MAVTDAQMQALITRLVGDVDPTTGDPTTAGTGIVATNMPTLWSIHEAKGTVLPALRRWYVQRDAYELVLAVLRSQYDWTDAARQSFHANQQVKAAEAGYQRAADEIGRLEAGVAGRGTPAVGTIAATAPLRPPDAWAAAVAEASTGPGPDPNSSRYSGSPYPPLVAPP